MCLKYVLFAIVLNVAFEAIYAGEKGGTNIVMRGDRFVLSTSGKGGKGSTNIVFRGDDIVLTQGEKSKGGENIVLQRRSDDGDGGAEARSDHGHHGYGHGRFVLSTGGKQKGEMNVVLSPRHYGHHHQYY